jgi:hypothetical protein
VPQAYADQLIPLDASKVYRQARSPDSTPSLYAFFQTHRDRVTEWLTSALGRTVSDLAIFKDASVLATEHALKADNIADDADLALVSALQSEKRCFIWEGWPQFATTVDVENATEFIPLPSEFIPEAPDLVAHDVDISPVC